MLLAGVLLLLGIASSKFSARLGVPVLVLFLSVGMLAGSEAVAARKDEAPAAHQAALTKVAGRGLFSEGGGLIHTTSG